MTTTAVNLSAQHSDSAKCASNAMATFGVAFSDEEGSAAVQLLQIARLQKFARGDPADTSERC
jgi:hypothetical protein